MKITGSRCYWTLGHRQATTFDPSRHEYNIICVIFIILMMISNATQQVLLGEDFTVTNASLAIL